MKPSPQEVETENMTTQIKRFSAGLLTGLVIAALYWSYAYWFGHTQALTTSILGSLLLAIICGLLTLKWGYKTLETLLELLP